MLWRESAASYFTTVKVSFSIYGAVRERSLCLSWQQTVTSDQRLSGCPAGGRSTWKTWITVSHHVFVITGRYVNNEYDNSHFAITELWNKFINGTAAVTPPLSFSTNSTVVILLHTVHFSSSIHLFRYYPPPPQSCLHGVCTRREFRFSLWGCCFFPCCTRLSFFSCMFSMLVKASIPACRRERVLSGAVP